MEKEECCYNVKCGRALVGGEGGSGWPLASGGAAKLCSVCAASFRHHTFCDTFHSDDPGWRRCKLCNKPIHCGCIASLHLFLLDDTPRGGGGIHCLRCSSNDTSLLNNLPPPPPPPPPPPTKKHPRHKPDCVCIVCNQPPSGYKHQSTCDCTPCQILKRRLQTQQRRRDCMAANKKVIN